jgi:hypothetical protein
MWILGDEPGATEITESEAVELISAGVGAMPAGVDTASSRGSAPTLPAPTTE